VIAALLALALSAQPDLRTTAERTGFQETGRYAEVERLCRELARLHPRRARCVAFGTTPAGRTLRALVLSGDGTLDPATARARQRPVLLAQGAIHAGELDGKDAFLQVARELLAEPRGGVLGRVTAVLVPVLNVDGHERFGPDHRPNQRGPAAGGWRTTAQNLNLNRDYVKADAPEMRALLGLLGAWDPILYADFHVTDGAQFEHDVAVIIEPRLGYGEPLRPHGWALQEALFARLGAQGHLPVDFYPGFEKEDDPTSGFSLGVATPRFSEDYWAARNRIGVLVEAHSWRTYRERSALARHVLRDLLALTADRGAAWREAAARAEAADAALPGRPLVLTWEPTRATVTIPFRGYAWERVTSPVSGKPYLRYDESRPVLLEVPLRNQVLPAVTTTLPAGGWLVPAPVAGPVAERLVAHGVSFERLAAARTGVAVEAFRASDTAFDARPYEGRQGVRVKGAWAPEHVDLPAGSLWIPAGQPGARMAAYLLDPVSPDSLLAWGFFNAWFERKEYLEDYVLEPWAAEKLRSDPAVRAAYEARIASDPAFAADGAARLDFFARLHPSFDAAWNRYPVVRTAARP
jgi:Zinc carboxypeptidase